MSIYFSDPESGYPLNIEQPTNLQTAVFGPSRLRDTMEDQATQDTTVKLVQSVMALCTELGSSPEDKVWQRTLVGMPKGHFWQRHVRDLSIAYRPQEETQGLLNERSYGLHAGPLAYARQLTSRVEFFRSGRKGVPVGIYSVKEGIFVHYFSGLPFIERQIVSSMTLGHAVALSEIKPASETETRHYLAMVHEYAAVNVPA